MSVYELSKHPIWVDTMRDYLQPYWDRVLDGGFAESAAMTRLTVDELRSWIMQMYPLIHTFPKFLAEALIKVEDDYSRSFLIDNIRVEKGHAEHWLWMAEGFGLDRQDLLDLASGGSPVILDVQSVTDWLWYINNKGSLAEAVAATSFAIEGVTGDLTRKALQGFEAYGRFPGVVMNARTSRWMRSHARYDDEHPKIALEVIKRYATTERAQQKVMLAGRRSLELLNVALNAAYRAYSVSDTYIKRLVPEVQVGERRREAQPIAFPDRRVGDRRNKANKSAFGEERCG
jgi:pyrroloquinoline quinone (PQQ) biosynthesis protein C